MLPTYMKEKSEGEGDKRSNYREKERKQLPRDRSISSIKCICQNKNNVFVKIEKKVFVKIENMDLFKLKNAFV